MNKTVLLFFALLVNVITIYMLLGDIKILKNQLNNCNNSLVQLWEIKHEIK